MGSERVNRIDWIDIFKGIVITLVVVGHSTGKFNPYIYQFHMAAFFFASGYVAIYSLRKGGWGNFILSKIYTILVPLFSMSVMLSFVYCILQKMDLLKYVDGFGYHGLKTTMRELIVNGNIYITCLGAAWFLLTIFVIFMLQKAMIQLLKGNIGFIYFAANLILYFLGYEMIRRQINISVGCFGIRLAFIGQLYFACGMLCKQYDFVEENLQTNKMIISLMLLALLAMWQFGRVNGTTVDYPSGTFPNITLNTLAALNGIILVITTSKLLDKTKKIKNVFMMLGKNSIGILLLHFIGMKCAFKILNILNIVDVNYTANLVPTAEIGNQYWWFIATVAIVFSYLVWSLMKKVRIARLLLGIERINYDQIIEIMKRNVLLLVGLVCFAMAMLTVV